MHIYKVEGKKESIICMRRDEFIYLVSQGIELLKEHEPRSGLPYLKEDLTDGYINFSVLDDKAYYEVLNAERGKGCE